MEQITVTLSREALEQLPASVLVALLIGEQVMTVAEPKQEIAPLALAVNEELRSLFPEVESRKKIKKSPYHHWTRAEDQKLRHFLEAGHQIKWICRFLGRDEKAVNYRIAKLQSGDLEYGRKRWTPTEENLLIELVGKSFTNEAIALELNRNVESIKRRIWSLRQVGRLWVTSRLATM